MRKVKIWEERKLQNTSDVGVAGGRAWQKGIIISDRVHRHAKCVLSVHDSVHVSTRNVNVQNVLSVVCMQMLEGMCALITENKEK